MALDHPGVRGEVFNLCESQCAPLRLWMEWIIEAAGAKAELVRVPSDLLPDDQDIAGELGQHWTASAEKARETLGWAHRDPRERVRDSVRWHLAHPPIDTGDDFIADDRALQTANAR